MAPSFTPPLKSNDDRGAKQHAHRGDDTDKTILPLSPHLEAKGKKSRSEMEIYARFMRHLRLVPNSRIEIKVLSAIQFTADMLDMSDALVAKTLVDLGLRSTRKAFPAAYLEFADKSILRKKWDLGGPSESLVALRNYWDDIGEDKFAAFRNEVPLVQETVYIER